nr:hypothetical protein [Tanacetum cinerariifolium]
MAISSSSSENEPCCSKACKKNTDSLNSKITELSKKLGDTKNMLYHYKLGLSQVEARVVEFKNQEIKFCEQIRGLEFSVECKTNRIESLTNELEELKKEKEGLNSKLIGFQSASKDLDNLLESQISDKNNEGLGYSDVPPPPAQVYSPPKKDMFWTGLPEFADDAITDYSRPSPTIESSLDDLQNKNPSETGASDSTFLSKPAIKFVKAVDRPTERPTTDKVKTAKKPAVKYAEIYRRTSKSPNFDHLFYDCGKWVDQEKTWVKHNYTYKSRSPRTVFHKTDRFLTRTTRPNMNTAPRPNVNNARPKTTQDLMIILIQRVKRLERELKARTPPTKIHKVDRGRSSIPTAELPLPVMSSHCQKKFPLLVKKVPLLKKRDATAEKIALLMKTWVVDPYLGNKKWYQSLVRSFDQEKNNIQDQQNLDLWPYQAQVQKMSYAALKLTGLSEFTDDTITDYSRPSPAIESNSDDLQNKNPSVTETGGSSSTILSKPAIKFVKAVDRPAEIKTNKVETAKKSAVKYAEMYKRTSKSSNNKACFNCGHFDHLSYDCGKWMEKEKSWPKNKYSHKSMPPKTAIHKIDKTPVAVNRPNVNNARPKTTQDLMIILIQRVNRLERELKARTPPTKIHKVDRGRSRSIMAWVPKKF